MVGDRRGKSNALYNLGLALDKLGFRSKAINYVKGALRIYIQIEDPKAEKARALLGKWLT